MIDRVIEIIDYLNFLPSELLLFILSGVPGTEIRLSIPYAMTMMDMPVSRIYAIAVIGNFIIVVLGLLIIKRLEVILRKIHIIDIFLTFIFKYTRDKTKVKYKKYGSLALIIIVTIPFPGSGAWTGAIATYIFDIPYKYSLPSILTGIMIQALILVITVTSIISII